MSDDESFEILGSSPMASFNNDGVWNRKSSIDRSSNYDTLDSRFTSLEKSQVRELAGAQEIDAQNRFEMTVSVEKFKKEQDKIDSKKDSLEMEENKELKLSGIVPQQQGDKSIVTLNLEDCALKSPLVQQQNNQGKSMESNSSNKTTPSHSTDGNLAASFIMGEINLDVLKTSVYSQFPSISLEASTEEVVKLQNMVTEHKQLQIAIKNANTVMKMVFANSLKWKEKIQSMEANYELKMDNCKKEIEELRKQNDAVELNVHTQIEALEIARKKDREEYIQTISEKDAVLENMRSQIIKLEEQQLNKDEIKYIDELNCLQVNLSAAEELIAENRSEIAQLKSLNIEKDQQIKTLETSLQSLQLAFEEQKEHILLLQTQNEVHRADFELEKENRESTVKEKQTLLQDLRSLQKKNQELIEEQQRIADNFHKQILSVAENKGAQINVASVSAQNYIDNPQRPIRFLPTLPSSTEASPALGLHLCPICNKRFKSLNILLTHVNNCFDNN